MGELSCLPRAIFNLQILKQAMQPRRGEIGPPGGPLKVCRRDHRRERGVLVVLA